MSGPGRRAALWLGLALAAVALSACMPPSGADYERHKANREAYKYQGF